MILAEHGLRYSIQHIIERADPCNDSICCLPSLQIIMNAVNEGTRNDESPVYDYRIRWQCKIVGRKALMGTAALTFSTEYTVNAHRDRQD